MNRTIKSALLIGAIFSLFGCDQNASSNKKSESTESSASSSVREAADAIIAGEESYKLDVTLTCTVQNAYLDGSVIDKSGTEKIKIERRRTEKTKENGTSYTVTNVEITSNGTKYDGSLISSGPSYAIASYGNLLKDGVTRDLFVATYMIDFSTKKLKRTVSFFQNGKEMTSEGHCE